MYSWHDKEYIGAAHGLAGILYLLLQVYYKNCILQKIYYLILFLFTILSSYINT